MFCDVMRVFLFFLNQYFSHLQAIFKCKHSKSTFIPEIKENSIGMSCFTYGIFTYADDAKIIPVAALNLGHDFASFIRRERAFLELAPIAKSLNEQRDSPKLSIHSTGIGQTRKANQFTEFSQILYCFCILNIFEWHLVVWIKNEVPRFI